MIDGERVAGRIRKLGFTQASLAREVGVTQQTIGKIVTGQVNGSSHLHKIARVLETTPSYLTGETDDPSEGFVPVPSTDIVADELGLVPVREIDLQYGMGATFLDMPVSTNIRHFPREWLRLYTNSPPSELFFAHGVGDSMSPTIMDNDLLLIDTSQKSLVMADKIWACAYGQSGMIKRLRQMADGSVKIISDNINVPHEIAYDGELHLIGRVVAIVRKS